MYVTDDELPSTGFATTKPWPASPETDPFVEPVHVAGTPIVQTRSCCIAPTVAIANSSPHVQDSL